MKKEIRKLISAKVLPSVIKGMKKSVKKNKHKSKSRFIETAMKNQLESEKSQYNLKG